jgi:hypothetical protein
LLLALRRPVRRVALDGVIQVRKAQRVAEKEHRRIVADDVPIALLGIELEGGAADVAFRIGAPRSPATVE